jgi:hypothetical protein
VLLVGTGLTAGLAAARSWSQGLDHDAVAARAAAAAAPRAGHGAWRRLGLGGAAGRIGGGVKLPKARTTSVDSSVAPSPRNNAGPSPPARGCRRRTSPSIICRRTPLAALACALSRQRSR